MLFLPNKLQCSFRTSFRAVFNWGANLRSFHSATYILRWAFPCRWKELWQGRPVHYKLLWFLRLSPLYYWQQQKRCSRSVHFRIDVSRTIDDLAAGRPTIYIKTNTFSAQWMLIVGLASSPLSKSRSSSTLLLDDLTTRTPLPRSLGPQGEVLSSMPTKMIVVLSLH